MFFSNLLAVLQFAFIGVMLIFFISWTVRKLKSYTKVWKKCAESEDKESRKERLREEAHNSKQDAWKQNLQQCFIKKVEKYKEEVLIPRDERRRERKEKEFRKFFGPLWSGEGQQLGGEKCPSSDDERELTESVKAARRRKTPEPDNSLAQTKLKEQKFKRPKKAKVIELPTEPAESDAGAMEVILRTPISTIVKRRFLPHHSVQNLLDFMTKSGFSQSHYQLCTSFPRLILSDSQVALCELGFGKRITLNVEDKSEECEKL